MGSDKWKERTTGKDVGGDGLGVELRRARERRRGSSHKPKALTLDLLVNLKPSPSSSRLTEGTWRLGGPISQTAKGVQAREGRG